MTEPIPAAENPSTPAPPAVGLPVERVPGEWALYGQGETDDPAPQTHGSQIEGSPIPLIGAINFGGVVTSSEGYPIPAGGTVELGERGRGRPRTTMIGLYSSDGTFGATVQLLGDQMNHSQAPGAFLPIGAGQPGICWLPLRRAVIRNASASQITLGVIVMQYDY